MPAVRIDMPHTEDCRRLQAQLATRTPPPAGYRWAQECIAWRQEIFTATIHGAEYELAIPPCYRGGPWDNAPYREAAHQLGLLLGWKIVKRDRLSWIRRERYSQAQLDAEVWEIQPPVALSSGYGSQYICLRDCVKIYPKPWRCVVCNERSTEMELYSSPDMIRRNRNSEPVCLQCINKWSERCQRQERREKQQRRELRNAKCELMKVRKWCRNPNACK